MFVAEIGGGAFIGPHRICERNLNINGETLWPATLSRSSLARVCLLIEGAFQSHTDSHHGYNDSWRS